MLAAFLLTMLSCSRAGCSDRGAEAHIGRMIFQDDSGPIPPQYQWESFLTVNLADKFLQVKHLLSEGCVACEAAEWAGKDVIDCSVELRGDWYDEFTGLLDDLRLCDIGSANEDMRIGGGNHYIIIEGDGLAALIRSGKKAEDKRIQFEEHNICRSRNGLWDDLHLLATEMKAACGHASGQLEARTFQFYHADPTSKGRLLTIAVDPITRTAVVSGSQKVKRLDKKELRRLTELASSVNYYADFEFKDVKTIDDKKLSGLFFSPHGDGGFFPFDGGIADPSGNPGGENSLRRFYKKLGGK